MGRGGVGPYSGSPPKGHPLAIGRRCEYCRMGRERRTWVWMYLLCGSPFGCTTDEENKMRSVFDPIRGDPSLSIRPVRWMPNGFPDMPFGFGEGLASGCKGEQPEAGVFVLFVTTCGVFIFFFFSSASVFTYGARRKAIVCVRETRQNYGSRAFPLVQCTASPCLTSMALICV